MPDTDFQAPDVVADVPTDVVGTPEGDGEFMDGVPLKPVPEGSEQRPRGGAPDEYRQEK